jgi:transposase
LVAVAKAESSAVLGLDVAKAEIVACVRWGSGNFERPWSVANPVEIGALVEICKTLEGSGLEFKVAMESTGTYGDSVRMAMTNADLSVLRVSGKGVSDYREIFDGVPSQHDGKDAAMIAELCAMGKGVSWRYESPSEDMSEIAFQVRRMDAFQSESVQWYGRLESQLARHWPELSQLVKLSRISVLRLLVEYGTPAAVGANSKVISQFVRWSKGRISEAKATSIVKSAQNTLGIPMTDQDKLWLQETSQRILAAKISIRACENKLKVILKNDVFWSQYVDTVSAGTLGVILFTIGDPRAYSSAGAILKGCGLNLKEVSSGKRVGEKAISKRGPSMIRRWLYFWAMRAIQREELREWYFRFHSPHHGQGDRSSKHRKMKALTCMMRKLIRSLWSSMIQGKPFDYSRIVESKSKRKGRRRQRTKRQ